MSHPLPAGHAAGPRFISRRERRNLLGRLGAPHAPRPRRTVRLWAPIALLWLILVPLAVLSLPILILAGLRFGAEPFHVLWRLGAVVAALSGTEVSVESAAADVRIKLV
jgi:hypothetical protein